MRYGEDIVGVDLVERLVNTLQSFPGKLYDDLKSNDGGRGV